MLEVRKGKVKLIVADSIKTDNDKSDSERFSYVEAKTVQMIYEYGPFDHVCRENFIKGGSKRSTQLVFGAWAATDTALGKYGYSIPSYPKSPFEITASRVKSLVGGHGSAEKEIVAEGAHKLLKLPIEYVWKNYDASDAAAIGYTFLVDRELISNDGIK